MKVFENMPKILKNRFTLLQVTNRPTVSVKESRNPPTFDKIVKLWKLNKVAYFFELPA